MVLRLTLDVNVWVNHYLALARGRSGSAAQQLARMAFEGRCRLGPVQPVISHAMLDTLQDVLVRLDIIEPLAEAARNAVEASATDGIVSVPPHLVLGGGVQPVKDREDREVLETAIAGRADLLVTNNMADFVPGPRSDIDAEIIGLGHGKKVSALLFRHPRAAHGLVIASVFEARSWLLDGSTPPGGVLERFLSRESGK